MREYICYDYDIAAGGAIIMAISFSYGIEDIQNWYLLQMGSYQQKGLRIEHYCWRRS